MSNEKPISPETAAAHACQLADSRRRKELESRPDPLADKLVLACQDGNVSKVRDLLASGADPNSLRAFGTALCCAMMSSNAVEVTRLLLAAAADPRQPDSEGSFPLFYAAANGHGEAIRLFVEAGADVNAQSSGKGWTALMNAACFGEVACAMELLDLGADVTIQSFDGITAFDIAKSNGRERVVQLLSAKRTLVADLSCAGNGKKSGVS